MAEYPDINFKKYRTEEFERLYDLSLKAPSGCRTINQ
jgi:hypothetical protein